MAYVSAENENEGEVEEDYTLDNTEYDRRDDVYNYIINNFYTH